MDFSLTDVAGPAFTGTTQLASTDDTVGPYVVDVMVTDISGIDSIHLHYTSSTEGGPFEVPLQVIDQATGEVRLMQTERVQPSPVTFTDPTFSSTLLVADVAYGVFAADSDGGGVSDGTEIGTDLTDPLDPADDNFVDTDGDGLADSDEKFRNTGIAWRDGALTDLGRFEFTEQEKDRGSFKTPTLRNVADRAPYMCALVEVEEDVRILTNLYNYEGVELRDGLPVKLRWETLSEDFEDPAFEPA